MWLIKMHIAFSILCIITFLGFAKVYKDQIKENGWLSEDKKKSPGLFILFFVPIMNVIIVLALFVMIGTKKEELEELTEYVKKESEE